MAIEKQDIASQITVGKTRIRDSDGFLATVVYLGPVASAKNLSEVYAGVIWDDPTRGKHDGSVISRATNELIRYFSAPPNGGSFLRISKMDFGVALAQDLIQERYVDMAAPLVAPNNLLPHTARTSSGKPKEIELLGELKIRTRQQVETLPKISLRSLGISKLGERPLTDVAHIQEVDLAGNLLAEWDIVWKIIESFPSLTFLSLASNKLHNVKVHMRPANYQMHTLNLHDCCISDAQTIRSIDQGMPNLQELCLASNNLSYMKNTELSGFSQLRILDCSDCQLTDWRPFSNLPMLETLQLDCNPMLTLQPAPEKSFNSLTTLCLTGTHIEAWPELDVLLPLPALTSLKLRKTPLTSTMGAAEARFLAIARLPALQVLNSTVISKKERTDAERRYVSYVAREFVWKEEEHVFSDHAQYEGLRKQHQDIVSAVGHSMAQAVNVTIRSMAASSCSMDAMQKRLPSTLTIGRVKALCARAYGLDVDLQILHVTDKGAAFPTPLDDNDHTLAYFGVTDGSEILMNEIDVEAQEREEQKRKVHHERQMKAHEDSILRQKEHQRNQQR